MRILLSIEHPAWAHQFRYVIRGLEKKGHTVKLVAINKDRDLELLDAFNLQYELISTTSGKNLFEKGLIFLRTTWKINRIAKEFKPDLFIGRASPMMAINSFLFRKNHVLFEDTEHSRFSLFICKLFSSTIITPDCFKRDLGDKQVKINTYKELFYLHPNYFKPNPETLAELGLTPQDKYIIVRFVAWDAHHDIGQTGIQNKEKVIHELEKYGRVLITSEAPLNEKLEKYKIKIAPEKLHDLLGFATLYFGEGATTASECAVLGTHAIYVNTLSLGYTEEEEKRYGLIRAFSDPKKGEKEMLDVAIELLKDPNLCVEGKNKRKKLLSDKIDATAFMVWLVDNYPESLKTVKENSDYQNRI